MGESNQFPPTVDSAYATEVARLHSESLRLAEETSLIAEIGKIISSSLDIDEIYERFGEEVQKLISFDRLGVTILDLTRHIGKTAYIVGTAVAGRQQGEVFPLTGTLTEMVARTRSSFMLELNTESDIGNHMSGLLPGFRAGLRSIIAVPLINLQLVIGVLQIRSKALGIYSDNQLDLAERIGDQIGGAIANCQLFSERIRLAEENRAIAEIGRVVSSSLDIGEVYDIVGEQTARLVPLDHMCLSLIDSENQDSTVTWVYGEDILDRRPGDKVPLDGAFVNRVILARSPVILEVDKESELLAELPLQMPQFRCGMRSFLGVPLFYRDKLIGVLELQSTEQCIYSEHDLNIAGRIGNQIIGAIANAQLYEHTRRAEEAVQESEELYRALVDNSILGMGLYREAEPLIFCNQRLTEIIGYTKEEVESPEFNFMDMFYSEDQELIADKIGRRLAGEHIPPYEVRLVTKDQTVKWLEIHNIFVRFRGERALQIQLLDVTERKQTEERMHETARLASIGELAAGVAHEINNPLTSVLGYSEMVLTKNLSGEVSEDIQIIYDEAQRAAKIVQNLLFFARRESIEKQYLDLNLVLIRALEMKSYDFKVSNINVETHLYLGVHKTMIDEHRIVQVFLNILTNSEQAMQQARGKGKINVCTVESDGGIKITIKDDGPGILSEDLNRIFEPFFTTKEVGHGTGLGLSISYGIIKQHGGEIWAESVEGDDTTFHITLPISEILESPALSLTDITTKHILVVDDEPQIRNLLGKYLESERYTVDLAQNGQEAWRKLASIDYDCILLDINMPGMSGQELYQLIRETSECLSNKVVFITGDTGSPSTRIFLSESGSPVLAKPFGMAELLQTIQLRWDAIPAGG